MPTEKTTAAFEAFRARRTAKELPPDRIANKDQIKPMHEADGLRLWEDGTAQTCKSGLGTPPVFTSKQVTAKMLWVVREADVAYAPETCAFGNGLKSKVIKHSNLTGGGSAYSGGEILMLNENTIALNGCSGRYGPRSEDELLSVANAFKNSGYTVWCTGFDVEAGFPLPFVGSTPNRID